MSAVAEHILLSSKPSGWLPDHKLFPMDNPAFTVNRRKFLKLTGGGLIVAFVFKDFLSFAGGVLPADPLPPVTEVAAWIHIGEDGAVSVYTGKVEFGQNIR